MRSKYVFSLIIFTVVILIVGCKKDSSKCEKWIIRDYCVKKQSNVACDETGTPREQSVCNDDIKLAEQGKQKVRFEDASVRLMTQYIRKVN